jgi:hypothetical protein
MTPFARYLVGYIDGYEGNDVKLPNDHFYQIGHSEGKEDDLLGAPSRFRKSDLKRFL